MLSGLNDLQKNSLIFIFRRVAGKTGSVGKDVKGQDTGEEMLDSRGILIIRPIGGLGSQLGLYALGRKISYLSNLELKIDVSFFENTWPGTTERSYRLHHFNIAANYATSQDFGKVIEADYRLGPWNNEYLYYSRPLIHLHHGCDRGILNVQANSMIIGDGVDFSYFDDIKCLLKKDLIVRTKPSLANAPFISRLQQMEDTASVHIRLTDYIPHGQENRRVWLEDKITFYIRAIRRLENETNEMEYYVFSDDQEELKMYLGAIFQGISSARVHVVEHNREENDYEDFRLMSLCKYHVTIGSVFSLWAAYLSKKSRKILLHSDANRTDIVQFLPAEIV